ncbi:MAG: hypothetical protein SFU25_05850 [Candidatus Caenarcaniphilales bacterium]|nr:hypothetical protein [Candidatus Caenarcaniphilales bacterium]
MKLFPAHPDRRIEGTIYSPNLKDGPFVLLTRHGHTKTQRATFGQDEVLSPRGKKETQAEGAQAERVFQEVGIDFRDVSEIFFVHSERVRTGETTQLLLSSFWDNLHFNGHSKHPEFRIIADARLNPPSSGDFQGLTKQKVYSEYAKKRKKDDGFQQIREELWNRLSKENKGKGSTYEIGKMIFRLSWMRSFEPNPPTWETRRMGETMEEFSKRNLECILEYAQRGLTIHAMHSHGVLGVHALTGAITEEQWKADPPVPKSTLLPVRLNVS